MNLLHVHVNLSYALVNLPHDHVNLPLDRLNLPHRRVKLSHDRVNQAIFDQLHKFELTEEVSNLDGRVLVRVGTVDGVFAQ